jgi:hypothetical protein
MKTSLLKTTLCGLLFGLSLVGCATKYNYSNYRAHFPQSILVLPPLNETTDVGATYGYLSTVTQPIAEMGYYVYRIFREFSGWVCAKRERAFRVKTLGRA